jgi:hypothetical protein
MDYVRWNKKQQAGCENPGIPHTPTSKAGTSDMPFLP